ncbi:pentapeptide repeat-containing protein [Taylorella asinigenitalis]|uniref:pentapeptide repeat-containing protein n=1 Tax=Taylorella asinigenitalis TaxID=84590 RepID=UPI00048B0277|nr:pentapeptide repeat-containing protein [Taylorella asinigenitalis]
MQSNDSIKFAEFLNLDQIENFSFENLNLDYKNLLQGYEFTRCIFKNINFEKLDIIDNTFLNCVFLNCKFNNCKLNNNVFTGCKLSNCIFLNCSIDIFAFAYTVFETTFLNCCTIKNFFITESDSIELSILDSTLEVFSLLNHQVKFACPKLNFSNSKTKYFTTNKISLANASFHLSDIESLIYIDSSLPEEYTFNKVSLIKSQFTNSTLDNIDFSGCDLSNSCFKSCSLKNCNFKNAKLEMCLFLDCSLENSLFNNSLMNICNFTGSNISGSNFENSDLSLSIFKNAQAVKCNFKESNLQLSDFSHSNITGSNFLESSLDRTKFHSVIDLDVVWGNRINSIGDDKDLLEAELWLTKI